MNCEAESMAPILFEEEEMAPILFELEDLYEGEIESLYTQKMDMFKSLSYDICWVDVDYPHSQYSGYQGMVKSKFSKMPFRVISDCDQASYELNTTKAKTRFILILSGRKKKNILKRVHDSVGVEKIFILKQFCKLPVENWPKVMIVPNFESLIKEVTKILTPIEYTSTGILNLPKRELFNLKIKADSMLMCEQCVRAIEYEVRLKKDTKRSKHKYTLAVGLLVNHFTEMQRGDRDIQIPTSLFAEVNLSKETMLDFIITLLKLSIEFDGCNYLFEPHPISSVAQILKSKKKPNIQELINFTGHVFNLLHSETLTNEDCKGLHRKLLEYLREANSGEGWDELHMVHMLLSDIDLCLKLFIELILRKNESFKPFVNSFSTANMVSDSRVSTVREIWKRSEFKPDENFVKEFPKSELKVAEQACEIKRIIFFSTTPQMIKLAKSFENIKGFSQYYFIHDFKVEERNTRSLKNSVAYFVVEHGIQKKGFFELIDITVRLFITPIFIFYLPSEFDKKIAKNCFRTKNPLMIVYCQTEAEIRNYLLNKELDLFQQMQYCRDYFGDFKKTLSAVLNKGKAKMKDLNTESISEERDGGWELLDKIDSSIFSELVEEKVLNSKVTGSIHYNLYNQFKFLNKPLIYWNNYASLFGATERSVRTLELEYARKLLKAYTLQTQPGFYKLMNDAFRSGNSEKIGMYRTFYTSLLTMVKNGLLRKYNGTVYRGTYFNPELIHSLKPGMKMHSTCFTSTSKSEKVAQEFLRKTKRNVILEIELDRNEFMNVDIHIEECSEYPEEFEVLLLPFGCFEIKSIYTEEVTIIRLVEVPSEISTANFSAVDYYG